MKNFYSLLSLLLCVILHLNLAGQNEQNSFPGIPLNPSKSVLFGKDIIIGDQPTRNQRSVAICSSFNGWLYAVVSRNNNGYGAFTFYKSTDSGYSWTVLLDSQTPYIDSNKDNLGLLVCGNTVADLTIYFSWIENNMQGLTPNFLRVNKFNANTGEYIGNIVNQGNIGSSCRYNDFTMVSDFQSPSVGSNPYSIGFLYSIYDSDGGRDSVVFCSSNDGGISITNRKVLAVSSSRQFGKVSLAYGNSPTINSGGYFAVWEDKNDLSSTSGHIYTSRTEQGITSSFTTPICLDCGDTSINNKCSFPAISCQNNTIDNDSTNITSVILLQKRTTEANTDIIGFYNLQAATTFSFHKMDIVTSVNNEIQPNITFNHFDNRFYMTYYDSTEQKLPSSSNNYNFINPTAWTVVSAGYNDSTNLAVPFPKVIASENEKQPVYVWNAERANGNGMALFDAEYSTYTGISKENPQEMSLITLYPNPCKSTLFLDLKSKKTIDISIDICDLTGQIVKKIPEYHYIPEQHQVTIDVSELPVGMYLLSLKYNDARIYKKFCIAR